MLRAFACGYTALAVLSGWAWVRPAVAMSRRRVLRTARLFLQVLIHLSLDPPTPFRVYRCLTLTFHPG
jgi:hypothetical protein